MDEIGAELKTDEEKISKPELDSQAIGRGSRIARLGLGVKFQRAREAATRVSELSAQAVAGVPGSARERMAGIAQVASNVVGTSRSTASSVGQRVQVIGGSATETVSGLVQRVQVTREATTEAAGVIWGNVSESPEFQEALAILKREGITVGLKGATAGLEVFGVPAGKLSPVAQRALQFIIPRALAIAEDAHRRSLPEKDESSPSAIGSLAGAAIEVAFPQIAAIRSATEAGKRIPHIVDALTQAGGAVIQEVRAYRQNPKIADAMKEFGVQPPPIDGGGTSE